MPEIIKIKCNGPGKHVNEVDLRKILKRDLVILESGERPPEAGSIPERIVLQCRECTYKVIVTREMIEENLGTGSAGK